MSTASRSRSGIVRKNDSYLTVDQVLAWVMAVLIVGVFNWLWWVVADERFRELIWRIGQLSMASYGLR
jgi:cytochrome b561